MLTLLLLLSWVVLVVVPVLEVVGSPVWGDEVVPVPSTRPWLDGTATDTRAPVEESSSSSSSELPELELEPELGLVKARLRFRRCILRPLVEARLSFIRNGTCGFLVLLLLLTLEPMLVVEVLCIVVLLLTLLLLLLRAVLLPLWLVSIGVVGPEDNGA